MRRSLEGDRSQRGGGSDEIEADNDPEECERAIGMIEEPFSLPSLCRALAGELKLPFPLP